MPIRTIDLKSGNIASRNDTLMQFLADVREYNVLSAKEEEEFFYKYKETKDPAKKLEMKQSFLSANARFLYSVAKRYEHNPSKVLDLVDQAYIGMDIAFDKFDVTIGTRFITYAVSYIRREITEYIYKVAPSVILPNVAKIGVKIPKIKANFISKYNREPSTDEIVEILESEYGTKVVNVADAFDMKTISVDEQCGSDEDSDCTVEMRGDFAMRTASYNDVVDTIENDSLKSAISSAMSVLSERERKVITMLFGLDGKEPMSPDDVAISLSDDPKKKLSATRIMQIRTSAINKLRNMEKTLLYA